MESLFPVVLIRYLLSTFMNRLKQPTCEIGGFPVKIFHHVLPDERRKGQTDKIATHTIHTPSNRQGRLKSYETRLH